MRAKFFAVFAVTTLAAASINLSPLDAAGKGHSDEVSPANLVFLHLGIPPRRDWRRSRPGSIRAQVIRFIVRVVKPAGQGVTGATGVLAMLGLGC